MNLRASEGSRFTSWVPSPNNFASVVPNRSRSTPSSHPRSARVRTATGSAARSAASSRARTSGRSASTYSRSAGPAGTVATGGSATGVAGAPAASRSARMDHRVCVAATKRGGGARQVTPFCGSHQTGPSAPCG